MQDGGAARPNRLEWNRCPDRVETDSVMAMLGWGIAMKRDDDLAREILLEIEAHDDPLYVCALHSGSDQAERIRYYHLRLLVDAGFLEESGKQGGVFRITNAGHDFLALTRQSEAWEATKAGARMLGGASLQMLLRVAEGYALRKLAELGVPVA